MRFMIIRKADKQTEAGVLPNTELLEAMGKYMGEMVDAGVLRAGEGLHPSAKGARVKFHKGKPTVIDGPFTEAKELIAGYAIIEVKSKAEALEWVKRWPALDGDGEIELELRQIFEEEDFGEEFTPEMREKERRMREEIEQRGRSGARRPPERLNARFTVVSNSRVLVRRTSGAGDRIVRHPPRTKPYEHGDTTMRANTGTYDNGRRKIS